VSKIRVAHIVGARPQFIKMAVVSRAIAERSGNIEEVIIHTGQHYDRNMSQVFFDELDIPRPDFNLGIGHVVEKNSHGQMIGLMIQALELLFMQCPVPQHKYNPVDCIIVYGDTNTTIAGALDESIMNIPVAHVEAGLRSGNRQMPEEINRVVADAVSDFLFTPTLSAERRLMTENQYGAIYNVGDIMFDSYLHYQEQTEPTDKDYYLVTTHRQANADDLYRFRNIVDALKELATETCPVIVVTHPRTAHLWQTVLHEHFVIKPPKSYLVMQRLIRGATVVLTDSGGIQKEAYFAKTPCVTLREETEWPETGVGGFNTLAGANKDTILEAVDFASSIEEDMWFSNNKEPFGNGTAGQKIVDILIKELG